MSSLTSSKQYSPAGLGASAGTSYRTDLTALSGNASGSTNICDRQRSSFASSDRLTSPGTKPPLVSCRTARAGGSAAGAATAKARIRIAARDILVSILIFEPDAQARG